MRNVVLGVVVGVGLSIVALAVFDGVAPVYAERQTVDYASSSELTSLYSEVDGRQGQLTLIDPRLRVVSVYHIDRESGEIRLRSVRNVNWDLQMVQFNSKDPLPREIQRMLEQR